MIADPRIAVTETDWDNLLKAAVNPTAYKFLLSARVAIRLRVLGTVSENPPNVSKARGMNWIGTSLQFLAYSDAFIMRLDCKGEVMVTSKAAGWPAFHIGKKISPGLELLSSSKLFCSEMGDKRAPKQVDIILSCIRSWQEILSPRPCMKPQGRPLHLESQIYKKDIFSRSRTILHPVDIWEQNGTHWKIGVVPELEWGLRITRHQTALEKKRL